MSPPELPAAPLARCTAALLVAALALTSCSGGGGDEARPTSSTTLPPSTEAPTTTVAPVDPFALRPPAPGGDPEALATQIVASERVLRDPGARDAAVAEAALAQQVAYRQLGDHPEWDQAVEALLPDDLRPSVALHTGARRELRALGGTARTSLPAWRIVVPPPLADLTRSYQDAGTEFGLDWPYLAAINLVETGFGRIRGTSEAGARGPMQFMPRTWAAYGGGGDIEDPHDAIFGAARLLAANRGATDMANALFQYNHSDRYVRAVTGYAQLIAAEPMALRSLYYWGVYYRTVRGDIYLPVGYEETAPVPVP